MTGTRSLSSFTWRCNLGRSAISPGGYSVITWLSRFGTQFRCSLSSCISTVGRGLSEEAYRVTVFGREVLRFCYQSVGLAHLDPREYLGESPLGAALAALMDRGKTRAPLELRVEMSMRVSQSGLDDARKALLVNVIESYFRLTATETVRYRQLNPRKENRKMEDRELSPLSWASEIELKAKSDLLLRQLTKKFGPLPDGTAEKVHAIEYEEIDSYCERILTASSLEEMGLA